MNITRNNLGAFPLDLDSGYHTPEFAKWARGVLQPGFRYHLGISEDGKSTIVYREIGGKLGFWARVPNSLNMFDVQYV